MAELTNMQQGGKRTKGIPPSDGAGPLVSIITVVYNGAATLERTIQSVLEQTHQRIQYIIMDGGSTDGTLDILRRYDDRIDFWQSAKDKGIYDAMNKGIAECSGEWVGMINADDWYPADAVSRAMDGAQAHASANIVHGDILIHYPNGTSKVKHAKLNGFLLKHWEMVLNHPSFFVRRSYYDGHPFNAAFRVGGDHHWTLRAWTENEHMFHYVPFVLAHFSVGGASATIPLSKAMREGDAISRDLGLGPWHLWMSRIVRVALHLPAKAKLWFNQFLAPLAPKQ
ncbi:MAG: glycosyltransferase [Flavobacteriales bacterium]|nr:glycosyltransferase [Flavobacteriales bacterium]